MNSQKIGICLYGVYEKAERGNLAAGYVCAPPMTDQCSHGGHHKIRAIRISCVHLVAMSVDNLLSS